MTMTFNAMFITIFLGIIGSLIANSISPYIKILTERLFSPLKEKHKKNNTRRQERIEELAANGTLLTLASMNSYFFDIAFFLTFIIFLLVPPVSLVNMLSSLSFGVVSMIFAYRGANQRKIVNEAVKAYKIKRESPTK